MGPMFFFGGGGARAVLFRQTEIFFRQTENFFRQTKNFSGRQHFKSSFKIFMILEYNKLSTNNNQALQEHKMK